MQRPQVRESANGQEGCYSQQASAIVLHRTGTPGERQPNSEEQQTLKLDELGWCRSDQEARAASAHLDSPLGCLESQTTM
jgi:hypothetical protein